MFNTYIFIELPLLPLLISFTFIANIYLLLKKKQVNNRTAMQEAGLRSPTSEN